MNQRANQFKVFLHSSYPKLVNQPIGLFGAKDIQLIASLISITQSGNAYLPLNPNWPVERLSFIIRQSALQACMVSRNSLALFTEALHALQLKYSVEELENDLVFVKIDTKAQKYPADFAYVFFPSGSTGSPKGIAHSSGSMTAFLNWCSTEFSKYKISRFVSIAPLNFDLSIFDVFAPLIANKKVFIPTENTLSNSRLFVQFLVENKIEAVYTTPSYLSLLLKTAQLHKYDLSFVKLILIAGEQLSYSLVNELKFHFKKAVFYNLYGPTETNVCTFYKIDFKNALSNNVPIGVVCSGSKVQVAKDGELLYKGKLLMKAFIDERGMTKISTSQYYKTGDIVKQLSNGNLEFIERKDKMIKRNGFRIELNEIKKVLSDFKGINACEIVVIKKESDLIYAFVESELPLSELEIKTKCLSKLPDYLLPDRIIVLRKFPLDHNHKLDIKKLTENYL